jgi:hypothetical protein
MANPVVSWFERKIYGPDREVVKPHVDRLLTALGVAALSISVSVFLDKAKTVDLTYFVKFFIQGPVSVGIELGSRFSAMVAPSGLADAILSTLSFLSLATVAAAAVAPLLIRLGGLPDAERRTPGVLAGFAFQVVLAVNWALVVALVASGAC